MKIRPSALLCMLIAAALASGLWLGNRSTPPDDAINSVHSPGTTAIPAAASSLPATTTVPAGRGLLTLGVKGRLMISAIPWGQPHLPPAEAKVSTASRRIIATALLAPGSIPPLNSFRVGDHVRFPLGGDEVEGVIQLVVPNDEGHLSVGGRFAEAGRGEFAINQEIETGKLSGHILDRKSGLGYQVESTDSGTMIHKKPIDALVCLMPRYRGPMAAAAAAAAVPQALIVPSLNSRPGAVGVLYLDFDGETVIDPDWNGGVTIIATPATIGSTAITSAQMTDVWKRVSEDYRPFDLNVTTDRANYDAAPDGHRARCIITQSDAWYSGSAGGVAFIKSYRGTDDGWSSTVPCWCWNNSDTAIMAMTISHELGHMMGLSHDGSTISSSQYYPGHDAGAIGWGPLMGAPFGKPITQWSKGEYPFANNQEDDFAIISATVAEPAIGNAYITDDAGDTTATAKVLAFTSPINQSGIITNAADVDFFSFKSSGGNLSVSLNPDLTEANLDAQLELYSSLGVLIQTSSQVVTGLGSSVSAVLPSAGTYYLAVRGRGRPASPGVTGYTSYGSAGAYTISGSYVPLPELPLITQQPVGVIVNQAGKAAFTAKVLSNSTMVYQWYRIVGGSDVKLTGKTTATLSFSSAQPADAGDYKLVATNLTGATTSDVVTLDVRYKPIVKVQPLPAKQTVAVGAMVSYTVTAEGTAPLSYQWKKNGAALSGEVADTLNLGAVDWYDGGASYTVTVTNGLGSTNSSAAALTVSSAPLFKQQPLPAIKPIALGGTGSMSVQVLGTPTIHLQWFKDTLPIPGATKTSYAWAATKLDAEGTYFVRATNGVGSTDSDPFTVDVQDKPVIDTPPAALTALAADQPLTLDCVAHGTATLLYQWQLNGKNVFDSVTPPVVTGAATAHLSIPAVSWLHQGTWRCVVTNAVGTATSKNAVVNVTSYPLILTPPPPTLKIAKNGTGTLKVVAGGSPTLKYQWFKDSVAIAKATAASLVLPKATVATTNGSYTVQVSNTQPLPMSGAVISSPTVVTVEDPPIVAAPSPLTKVVGIGDTVTFTGSVTAGSPVLLYQWQKNNVNISGEHSLSLTLTDVQTSASGSYRLMVTNDVGKGYSTAAKLTVLTRPVITQDPVAQTVYAYDSVTFTAKATGSATLLYQWYKDTVAITGNTTAKTAALKLTSVQAASAGLYSVTVTNAVGVATSASAQLTVNPVPLPTLTDVRPTNVIVGSKMDVFGTNLQWTTKVTINGKTASFVKVRSNELIVTVPAGIAAAGTFTVQTLGGIIDWPSSITLDTNGAENDHLLNAKLMFGTYIYAGCDNTTATEEPGDYSYDIIGKTVWFRWRAPFTGKAWFSTAAVSFHYIAVIFSGPATSSSTSSLHYLYQYQNHFGYGGSTDLSDMVVDVTMGSDYYVMIDSAHLSGSPWAPDEGLNGLQINKYGGIPKAIARAGFNADEGFLSNAPLDGQNDWQTEGGTARVQAAAIDDTDLVGFIGGKLTPGSTAVAASLPATNNANDEGPVVRASADFSINTPASSAEQFSWALYDTQGSALVALVFRNTDHSIIAQVNGHANDTSQIFVPGAAYTLDMEVDRTRHTWSIALNGITIAQGDHLLLPPSGLSHFAAGWRPALGATTGGTMQFDNVSITSETPSESTAEQ